MASTTSMDEEEATIVLSNMGKELDDRMLLNMYRIYGPIRRVYQNGTNSAHVVFEQVRHARKAVHATNGSVMFGKTLNVKLQPPFTRSTQPCRGFEAGICRRGDLCKYFHGMEFQSGATGPPMVANTRHKSLSTSTRPSAVPSEIQAIPSQKLCRHFSRGYCSLGETCSFAHVLGLPVQNVPKPTGKIARPCLYFRGGHCTRGDACRYVHEPGAGAVVVQSAPPVAVSERNNIDDTSGDHSESNERENNRTCVECELPHAAVWQCAKCDDSLYCDKCNLAVHQARVMAKHERIKLPPLIRLPRCQECEKETSSVRCEQCDLSFCALCDATIHKFKSLRKHVRVTFSASKSTKRKQNLKAVENDKDRKETDQFSSKSDVTTCVAYVESVPQLEFSSDSASSESDDQEMNGAVSLQSNHEKLKPVVPSSGLGSEDDFDDVKLPPSTTMPPARISKAEATQTSESESDSDLNDKPANESRPFPASVPKSELSSDSDDEVAESTSGPAAALSEAASSESRDNPVNGSRSKRTAEPTPSRKPTNTLSGSDVSFHDKKAFLKCVAKKQGKRPAGGSDSESSESTSAPASALSEAASSESDDSEVAAPSKGTAKKASTYRSEDNVSLKSIEMSTRRPAQAMEVSSESSDSSEDETPVKAEVKKASIPATKVTDKKKKAAVASTSTVSSSKSSSARTDKRTSARAAGKPAPAPRRAPASSNHNKGSISKGSSHSLVKKIETYHESGDVGELHLDAQLNGFERLLAHDCAERLGLAHESVGSGLERHLIISRRGAKRPTADSACCGSKSKKTKHGH
ncbi:hypothetical protein PsorP6_013124 [Peronosclerospora sorghi]|uniref:Uncharacterized protein n=1 Tax=Peronosclerospora sorghi TaxID=230839 RepID=A0ACC0WIX2_9STRA|nr:hypothetical protein PsorP6_013124 [Peronosclerospora sorghi]